MSNKAFILSMYLVALFIILKNYYNKGNSGMPYPTTITAPSYLYGVLALTSDFTEGLSGVLAAGLTLALFYRTHMTGNDPISIKTGPGNAPAKITPHNQPGKVPQATKPGTNK
jgi:hypothetical protein